MSKNCARILTAVTQVFHHPEVLHYIPIGEESGTSQCWRFLQHGGYESLLEPEGRSWRKLDLSAEFTCLLKFWSSSYIMMMYQETVTWEAGEEDLHLDLPQLSEVILCLVFWTQFCNQESMIYCVYPRPGTDCVLWGLAGKGDVECLWSLWAQTLSLCYQPISLTCQSQTEMLWGCRKVLPPTFNTHDATEQCSCYASLGAQGFLVRLWKTAGMVIMTHFLFRVHTHGCFTV